MAGFGEDLRSERERRGISLETLSDRTKVIVRHFRALEDGDYATLPGGVFRRGIVRAYLGTVGLEEQVWMPRFDASHAAFNLLRGDNEESRKDGWATFAANVKKSRGTAPATGAVRWLGVLLLLLLLVVAGWAVWHFQLHGRRGGDDSSSHGNALESDIKVHVSHFQRYAQIQESIDYADCTPAL